MHVLQSVSILKWRRPTGQVTAMLLSAIILSCSIPGVGVVDLVADPVATRATDLHGDSLPPGAVSRLGTIRLRHGSRVGDVEYSRDGQMLISRSGSLFYVWDANSGKLLRREDLYGVYSLRVVGDTMMVAKDKSEMLKPWKFTDLQAVPPQVQRANQSGGEMEVAAANAPRLDNPRVGHFTLSPDGKTVATATYGQIDVPRKIQLWRFEPNKKLTELEPLGQEWTSSSNVKELIFSDDGRRLLVVSNIKSSVAAGQASSRSKAIRIMVCDVQDVTSPTTMLVPKPAQVNQRGFAVSPDGKHIAIGTNGGKLLIYDTTSRRRLHRLEVPQDNPDRPVAATVLAFAPDGKQLAGGGQAKKIWFWDIESGELERELAGHRSWVEHLDYSPDGRTLASGGQDGVIYQWDVASGRRKNADWGHEHWVFGASLSHDGTLAATCSADGTTRIWEAATGKQRHVLHSEHVSWTTSCRFSPDGTRLAVTESRRVVLYDVATGQTVWNESFPEQKRSSCSSVSFSSDGKRMAAIVDRSKVIVWEPARKVRLAEFETARPEPQQKENANATEEENRRAASLARDNSRDTVTACLSPNGRWIAIGTRSRMAASAVVEIWDVDSQERIQTLVPKKGGASQVQFSPDGMQLVTAGHSSARGWVANNREISSPNYEDSLILWDVASGKVIHKFGSRQSRGSGTRIANGVTFSPDGRHLITAERAGTVLIYDVATGKQLAEVHGHTGRVKAVAMSADAKRLLSVSMDHTGLVWDFGALLKGVNKRP